MKILYVILSVAHYVNNEPIIKYLYKKGHEINILFDPKWANLWSKSKSEHVIQASMAQMPGLKRELSIERKDQWTRFIINTRELLSYSSYLNRKEQSAFYLKRQEGYLYRPVGWLARRSGFFRFLVASKPAQSLLRAFERLTPPYRKIIDWLKGNKPNIVIASPCNMRFPPEVEYLKAAKRLGIPTAIPVFSWDNLTTKGLFHVCPDILLVWNNTQVDEAMSIHRIPVDNIAITGAPAFDRWLNVDSLALPREEFCRKVGLDPARPFVVYLGSSKNIATDESWLVHELINCLRKHPAPELKNMNVLIRPHPGHAKHFGTLKDEAAIWPLEGAIPDSKQTLQDFYNSLKHCTGAVGINNSAMLEALINDKPCISIITERYKTTQMQTGHFKRLLDFDVLELAETPEECAEIINKLLQGDDSKKESRRRFVQDFIRPRGLNISAGEIAGRAIELAAQRKSLAEINAELDSFRDK